MTQKRRPRQSQRPSESEVRTTTPQASEATYDGSQGIKVEILPGLRVDSVLSQKLPFSVTRSRVQRALRDGGVLLNGSPVQKPSTKVRQGDCLVWLRDAVRQTPGAVEPEDIPLHIYFEDAACIVLEKPSDMVVHPAMHIRSGTLVNALLHYTHCTSIAVPSRECCSDSDGDSDIDDDHIRIGAGSDFHGTEEIVRPGIVHRLDRGTSGVMVVAKTERAHAFLMAQFADRTTSRTYVALVWGVPHPKEGTIATNIGRDPYDRFRMAVVGEKRGKHAITHYKVLEELDHGHVSIVHFKLSTGRTHQIRVHGRHIGHPLLGDATYNGDQLLRGPRTAERVQLYAGILGDKGVLHRPALHAETLGFTNPLNSKWMEFHSVLPPDMTGVITALRGVSAGETAVAATASLNVADAAGLGTALSLSRPAGLDIGSSIPALSGWVCLVCALIAATSTCMFQAPVREARDPLIPA